MEIVFKNVSFSYDPNKTKALDNISVCMEKNKIHGIIGPIGSGKTTMIELMNGITKLSEGEITIGKYNLTDKKRFNFNKFRYDVGLVYQFPEKQFFCSTVEDEIAFSGKMFNSKNKNLKNKVKKVLKMVGLDESYLKRNTFNLNCGEKRKVAIASVLISNPKLVILDEPTIGLDNNGKKNLMKLIKTLKTRYMKTIIIVTHDVDMLYEIVDNVIVLNKGKLVKQGSKEEVFSDTLTLYKNDTPIPGVVKVCKVVYEKTGQDLGYVQNINSLVRAISKTFNKEGDY